MLTPVLFNIYTNDQPIGANIQHFLYEDDLAVTVQGDINFKVEQKMQRKLQRLDKYYTENASDLNPAKSQIRAFHLKNAKVKCKLEISWRGC